MKQPTIPCIDYSKVESVRQVPSPKMEPKHGYQKKARVLSRQQIKDQLNNPDSFVR